MAKKTKKPTYSEQVAINLGMECASEAWEAVCTNRGMKWSPTKEEVANTLVSAGHYATKENIDAFLLGYTRRESQLRGNKV